MKARKIVLKRRPEGAIVESDFELQEEDITDIPIDGEILCRAEWLSVDPYMRGAANRIKIGEILPCVQVAIIIKSGNAEYPEGSKVVGLFGWRDYTLYKPNKEDGIECFYKLPDMKSLPDSYALGAVGRPGNTAYFGLLNVGNPKSGETVVVSAAAGAVGSLVGQIAKLKGCRVIGFAGSDEKATLLTEQFHFDEAFNYKTVDINEALRRSASKGVDVYFDNVGGDFAYQVLRHMNQLGRIALCGAISSYDQDPNKPLMIPFDYTTMIYKNIKLEGLHVLRWRDRWFEGINQMRDWILEGKINVKETVIEGFTNMPKALITVLEGRNIGKTVVKA